MNILKKLSFKYRVYHSIMYTSRLHDAAVVLASEIKIHYALNNIPEVDYYEGKYAKLKFPKGIEFYNAKKDIRMIMDKYNKPYFSDISIKKVTNKKIIIYINFK